MSKSRKHYEKSFKENAVKLSSERKNISSLAKELGISSATLHRWRKEFDDYGHRSMSRKGNCWDNSVAESFFKSLKTEAIYGNKRLSKQETKLLLFEYIEIWYNKNRRHSTLNYMTIEEFENANQKILNVA